MNRYRACALACLAIAAACASDPKKIAENKYVLLSEPVDAHEADDSFMSARKRAEVFCARTYRNMQTVIIDQATIEMKGGRQMITYYFSCGERLPD